jgi:4a-hydroxytetrahydrobiopterin dehydratase
VDDGDVDALCVTEEKASGRGFTPAPFGEGNVVPTGEQVEFVPERLAMADEDQIRHGPRLPNVTLGTHSLNSMARLTRTQAQAVAQPYAWRYLLGRYEAVFPVASLVEAAELASVASAVSGAGSEVSIDLRSDRVRVMVGGSEGIDASLTQRFEEVAGAIRRAGWTPAPPTSLRFHRPSMAMELAIDAVEPAAIRPFWKAALNFVEAPDGSLYDPADQFPAIWFQEMEHPRTERNRIHVDVTVAHDEADARIAQVIAAGGVVGPTSLPPSFTVLIDPEGNEVCICTWLGRDAWGS